MEFCYKQKGKDQLYHIWHTHEDSAELIFFHSDGGNIVFQEYVTPIRRGDFYLIPPGVMHYTLPSHPAHYERSKILLSESELHLFSGIDHRLPPLFYNKRALFSKIKDTHLKQFDALFEELSPSMSLGTGNELSQKATVLKLLAYFLSGMTDQISISSEFISRAMVYLHSHLSDQIRIDDVCNAANTSKFHLCRTFKQTTGLTIMEYLLKTRLETAKQLLVHSSYPITEISEKCGFSSISYFCRVFREHNFQSPLQYRKEISKIAEKRFDTSSFV